MSNDHKKGPGAHYSGANPIPNIQRFVEGLDSDKRDRDAKINEHLQQRDHAEAADHPQGQPHGVDGTRKIVTDPTTGKDVEIEDVNADFMKAVDKPQVCQFPTPIPVTMAVAVAVPVPFNCKTLLTFIPAAFRSKCKPQ